MFTMADLLTAARTMRDSLRTPTLPVRVGEMLQELILSGGIQPGERIIEQDLARELGISRTSLREAMIALESDGFLTRDGGRSRIISTLTECDVVELYEIWAILESEAVARACRVAGAESHAKIDNLLDRMDLTRDRSTYHHLNLGLHRALVECSPNARLLELYDSTVRQVRWAWNLSISQAGEPEKSQREHREIVKAFKARDVTGVSELVRAHLDAGTEAMTGTIRAAATANADEAPGTARNLDERKTDDG